ncbi:MAG: hypothetical protein V4516_17665, partial [Pseudomonadota bacterium]
RQAHNLKAAGSNPAPATKIFRKIKDFKAERFARLLSFQILVNTWSTFYEAPYASNLVAQKAAIMRPPCMPVQAKPRSPRWSPERLYRKLQRAAARRIAERNPVPVTGSCPRHAR